MKSIAIFIVLLITFCSCKSQEKRRYYITEKDFINDGSQDSGFGFLFQLRGLTVYNHAKKEFRINIPANFDTIKTAWGILYFPGLGKNTTRPDIFFLLHSYDSSQVELVVDKNGNRDFTDDSISIIESGKWVEFQVANSRDNNARVYYQLLFRNDIRDTFYSKLQKAMAIDPVHVLPYRYMVFDKTKNFRKLVLPDSNIVTLCDADINGFFNDKNDRVIAGDIQQQGKLYNNPVKSHKVEKGAELPYTYNTYRLLEVDKYGNGIAITALNKIIDSTEVLPGFQYTDSAGRVMEFQYKTEKEYTVLYIWGLWCIGCHLQAPAFATLMRNHQDKADFYTFNTWDKEEQMRKYLDEKKYPFQSYHISKAQIDILKVESFPTYLVISKKQQVLLRTSNVEELASFLEK